MASLFLELALIRWISTEIRIFAYLQNSVLVACLLGLGMGCFGSRTNIDIRMVLLPVVALVVLLSIPNVGQTMGDVGATVATMSGFHVWGSLSIDLGFTKGIIVFAAAVLITAIATALVLSLVWMSFIPLGRLIGGLIERHPSTVAAYSINIAGSMVGIALFTGLSALWTGPVAWSLALVPFLGYLAWQNRQARLLNLGIIMIMPVIVAVGQQAQLGEEVVWSPYQKLELDSGRRVDPVNKMTLPYRVIRVNRAYYQVLLDLKPETISRFPGLFDQQWAGLSQYDLPFRFKKSPEHVLLVGTGSGNDVAGALRNGVGQLTAVEIDPAIADFGVRYHPEKPYDSDRVKVVIDDARSFFNRTAEKYDLIVFGLLDSHTTGAMTNARLDHYVYTMEAITKVRDLLKPNGVMTLVFEANKPFLLNRIHRTLSEIFGRAPLVFRIPASAYGWGGVMFVTGDSGVIDRSMANDPALAGHIAKLLALNPVELTSGTEPTTDDWPYLYLESRHIPLLFFVFIGIMLAIFFVCSRWVGLNSAIHGWKKQEWHFFFLGAAFMLLEVVMISKSAVVFGSVWTVNAIIIGGILSMILLANLIRAKVRHLPMRMIYVFLIVACIFLYFTDIADFAGLAFPQKVFAVAMVATFPMLFSGLVFIDSFEAAESKAQAFGANLLGALVGGLLQITTFLTGIQFMLLIVGALYVLAVFFAPAWKRS